MKDRTNLENIIHISCWISVPRQVGWVPKRSALHEEHLQSPGLPILFIEEA
jgi:hypothetical protein